MLFILAGWRSTSSRRGSAITVNFAIPRVMPGNAVDTMLAQVPDLDANSLQRARRPSSAPGRTAASCSQYFTYLGDLAHGNLGVVGQPVPRQGHDDPRADAAVDADPRRHRDGHQLRARHAARDPRRLAARRLARPRAAGVHVPAGDAVLLPRAGRDRAVRGATGACSRSARATRSACPRLELAVHLERDLPLGPAGADDHRSPRSAAGCSRCAT